ncbi:wax synthase family protein [Pleurotus pulmonarius]|nr:hypothetical protein EYR38_007076 [Pleurotus pulmonarius]
MPHRVPLTPILSLLPYVITILALALPSPSCHSLPLRLSLILVILSLTIHILTSTALPLASLNFSQGAALAAHLFATTDFLLLSDVHAELNRDGQTRAWETMGVCERVRWAASLVTSPRLIGWSSTSPPSTASTSPPSTSKPPSTPSFILHQSLHLLLELLTLLTLLFLSTSLPHLSAPGPALASAPYLLRLLYTPLLGLAMYLSIEAPHRLYTLSLLCIANPIIRAYNVVSVHPLVVWTPADFRPLFGEWRDAYTLRSFWGRTWQQTHRRKFKAHSRFITSHLPLHHPLSRTTRHLIDLYTAFLISGLMHAAGEYMMLSSHTQGAARLGGSMRFFLLQAVGIHVESVVLRVLSFAGGCLRQRVPRTPAAEPTSTSTDATLSTPPPPPLLKILSHICGYICVWTWFAHTAPILFDPLLKAGFVDDLRASLGGWGVS